MRSEKETDRMIRILSRLNTKLLNRIKVKDKVLKDIKDWTMHSGVDAYQNCEYGDSARHAFYLMESEISQVKNMAQIALKE